MSTTALFNATNEVATVLNASTAAVHLLTNVTGSSRIVIFFSTMGIVRYVGNVFVAIFLLISNGLTIAAVLTTEQLRTKTNAILTSLAFSDIGTAFTLIEYLVYSPIIGGDDVCEGSLIKSLLLPLERIPIVSSALHLILVILDRYIAVVFPLRYDAVLTKFRIGTLIVGAWLLSVVLVLNYYTGFLHSATARWCTVTINFVYESALTGGIYVSIAFVMVILYGQIIAVARRHKKEIRRYHQIQLAAATATPTDGGQIQVAVGGTADDRKMNEARGARMIAAVLVSFLVLWSPKVFGDLIAAVHGAQTNLSNSAISFGLATGACNMATNFVIYAALNGHFARAFKRILHIGGNSVKPILASKNRSTQSR